MTPEETAKLLTQAYIDGIESSTGGKIQIMGVKIAYDGFIELLSHGYQRKAIENITNELESIN